MHTVPRRHQRKFNKLRPSLVSHLVYTALFTFNHSAWSAPQSADAFDLAARISSKAYVDLRWQYFNGQQSWLSGGTGSSRFDENQQGRPLLADFAAEIKADLSKGGQIITQVHAYPEQTSGIEISELYWQYRPLHNSKTRSRWRVGMFYPKLSIENRGRVWSSLYGLNYSAINTWLAEELRAIGIEGHWKWPLFDTNSLNQAAIKASVNLAIFAYNDPTGSALAWKGWSNHDRQSGWGDKLPFNPSPGIHAAQNPQANHIEAFREIDNRPGFYLGLGLSKRKQFKAEVYYYDNQAQDTAFSKGQYAWRTRFTHISAHYFLTPEIELYSQAIKGSTTMGQGFVDNSFYSTFVGIAKTMGDHQLSMRFERSIVKDRDQTVMDDNNDAGNSTNINYSYYVAPHWKFSAEYQQRRSRQARRLYLNDTAYSKEDQLSFSARYHF